MKRAQITSLILGLIFVFGLGVTEAATTNLYLTIEPNPFLEFLNETEDTIIFSGESEGIYYFSDPSGNQIEIITGEAETVTLKWSISEESGAIILTIL